MEEKYMAWYHYLLGALLILGSVVIIVVVLMQEGRSQNLSGAIGGGSDGFEGKIRGRSNEARLEKLTKILITVFFVVVFAAFLIFLFV